MRKIRQTKQFEGDIPQAEVEAGRPFPQAFSELSPQGEDSPEARLRYLGAVVHAAPPVLAVEATPVEATRMDGGENAPARNGHSEAVRLRAREIVMKNTLLACGLGLVPLPLADLAGGTIITGSMLKALADNYGCDGVTWSASSTAALLATIGTIGGGGLAAGLLLRFVPVAGRAIANAALPAAMGVAAYAVGMAAVRHFESGGRAVAPSLTVLLAGARRGWKDAERKVASFTGRDMVRLKA